MSTEVVKISENASVTDLISTLTRHRITGLPVINNKGKLVGVVSEFDVIQKKGKTVGDLVREMSQKGLQFAPAANGDEAAYMALWQALSNTVAQGAPPAEKSEK